MTIARLRGSLVARSRTCLGFASVIFLILSFTAHGAAAQSLQLLEPSSPVRLTEGLDFATHELRNPWDFSERRDFGWEENFAGQSVRAADGVWSGNVGASSAYVFPLFHGFPNTVLAEGNSGDRNLPRFGTNHPIESSRYTLFSYRSSVSERTAFAIYWARQGGGNDGWPTGTDFVASSDTVGHGGKEVVRSGFEIGIHDLKNLASFEQRRGSWSGAITSLRFDPTIAARSGAQVRFDWMRLVDPSSGTPIRIRWATVGFSEPQPVYSIYMDNDPFGYDGSAIKHFQNGTSPGYYDLNSAVLPPGTYYFYVTAHTAEGVVRAQTPYSAPITITARPTGYFQHPSATSGEEFSRSTGNPWDMTDAGDVSNLSGWPAEWMRFVDPAFGAGEFQATAVAVGHPTSDAQVHLPVPASAPIDARRFRYFSYKLAVDGTQYPTIADKIRDGWVARAVFWGPEKYSEVGSTRANIVYEGSNAYIYDLWDPRNYEPGRSYSGLLHYLRLDPVETAVPTRFWLDYVALHAEPRSELAGTNEYIDFQFVVEDADSSSLSVSLGVDADRTGFNGETVAVLTGLRPGPHSVRYQFPAQGGKRWLFPYLTISDGSHSVQSYADVPFVVGPKDEQVTPIQAAPPIATASLQRLRISRAVAVTRVALSHPSRVRRAFLSVRERNTRRARRVTLRSVGRDVYEGRWRVLRSRRVTLKAVIEAGDGSQSVIHLGNR